LVVRTQIKDCDETDVAIGVKGGEKAYRRGGAKSDNVLTLAPGIQSPRPYPGAAADDAETLGWRLVAMVRCTRNPLTRYAGGWSPKEPA